MRVCIKCGLEKEIYYFRNPNKNICVKCEIERTLNRMKKYRENSMGLENLDIALENIITLSQDLKATYTLPLPDAIDLVTKNKAQVYKPDMIYMIDPEDDNWVVRYSVLEKDNYECHYCGKFGNTVDHIIPKSKGGEFTEENLVCSCQECNRLKKTMSYDDFIANRFSLRKELLKKRKQKLLRKKLAEEDGERAIEKRKGKPKNENRIPKVLLKHKDKYGY